MAEPTLNPAASKWELVASVQQVFQLASGGDATTLAARLNKGLPPNKSNDKGDTLLMVAAYHGHGEPAQELLHAGADLEHFNDMAQTPWGAAAFKSYLPQAPLAHGAQPDVAPPGGETPLMLAMFGPFNALSVLAAEGADVDAESSEGSSAAELAGWLGAVDTAASREARATRRQAA